MEQSSPTTTTTPQPPSTSATQTRILTHMNTSHRDSLSLFLRHYCHLPSSCAPPASTTLTTLTLSSLTITSQGKRYYIPLTPPMPSYSSTRQRMEEMHYASLSALDLSPIKLPTYIPPRTPIQQINFLLVLLTFSAFSRRSNFAPGSAFYETLHLGAIPSVARFGWTIQPWLIWAMLGIHVGEVVWVARGRLRRHGVEVGSWVWWAWVGSCFVEGVFAVARLDGWVRERERERAMEDGKEKEKEGEGQKEKGQ